MLLQQEVQFVGFAASRSSVKGSSFNAHFCCCNVACNSSHGYLKQQQLLSFLVEASVVGVKLSSSCCCCCCFCFCCCCCCSFVTFCCFPQNVLFWLMSESWCYKYPILVLSCFCCCCCCNRKQLW